MTTNRVHGNNYGVMTGTITGGLTIGGGKVRIGGTTDDTGVTNEVYGDNYGVMSSTDDDTNR
ncbi:hypothetical protein ACVDFE_35860 [Lentzea chajnantorensis]